MRHYSRASAPAKAILFGEHFVVYDRLAVVAAIDLRAHVSVRPRSDDKIVIKSSALELSGSFTLNGSYRPIGGSFGEIKLRPVYAVAKRVLEVAGVKAGLDITIESQIPIASGLGSSAAVVAAAATAVSSLLEVDLSKDDIFRLALEAEKIVHGNPSGVDPAASTYGGLLTYRRCEGVRKLKTSIDLPLILGDTRVRRETARMVKHVSELLRLYPGIMEGILEAGERVARMAVNALEAGDLKSLGRLMNINHALLYAIGVSSQAIEGLVWAARGAGALGAKLTGAGGGGCIIALAEPENRNRVAEAIRAAGGEPIIVGISYEGARVEE